MRKVIKAAMGIGSLGIGLFGSVMADPSPAPAPMTFSQLAGNISSTADNLMRIVMIIITVAGVMLIFKGIIHLKQNYTSAGGGQEKHLTKGIASLIFGACLFIVVPITHVLVGGISGDTSGANYNKWTVGYDSAQSLVDS